MASVGELTATLRANTSQFTAPMQDAVAQLRQLGIEAGKATGAERAFAVAQQQAILQGLKKQGLVVINGQLVASETAAAEAAARTSAAYSGGAVGIGRIERSIASLISRSIGLPTQFGSISASLARMGAGLVGSLGIVAALGLVTLGFSALIDKMRETAKEAEEATKRIQDAFNTSVGKDQYDDVNRFKDALDAAQATLAKMESNPRRTVTRTVLGPTGQAESRTEDVGFTQAQIDTARQNVIAAQNLYTQAERNLRHFHQSQFAENQKAATQAQQVIAKSIADQQEALREFFALRTTRQAAMAAAGLPTTGDGAEQLLGASDEDFRKALEAWHNFDVQVNQDRIEAFNNRVDAAQRANDEMIRKTQELTNQFRRVGDQLAHGLAQGIVEGNLETSLINGLKRVLEDVVAALLKAAIFKPLEDALVGALVGGNSGGGLFGFLGGLLGIGATVATGGAAGPAILAPTAAHGAATLARGAAPTLIVNASGSMPAPLGPVEHARDRQWLAVFAETARVAPSLGIRLGVQ